MGGYLARAIPGPAAGSAEARQVHGERVRQRCACHPEDMYRGLVECPRCHHWSLDTWGEWAACERRRCGYETTRWKPKPVVEQPNLGL